VIKIILDRETDHRGQWVSELLCQFLRIVSGSLLRLAWVLSGNRPWYQINFVVGNELRLFRYRGRHRLGCFGGRFFSGFAQRSLRRSYFLRTAVVLFVLFFLEGVVGIDGFCLLSACRNRPK